MNTKYDKENNPISEIHSKQGPTEPAETTWKESIPKLQSQPQQSNEESE